MVVDVGGPSSHSNIEKVRMIALNNFAENGPIFIK